MGRVRMLERFGSGLKETFRKITGMGMVDKEAVEAIIRDLQRTLLSSDVDVTLVMELSERIRLAIRKKPPAGMTLKEHLIKVLYDEIVAFLGEESKSIELGRHKILLIGLFGSGKTTTAAKLARWFKKRGLRVGLVACDVHRAAAQEQLEQLGRKLEVNVYREGKDASEIAKKALKMAKEEVLIFDSAGRDALDKDLAQELRKLSEAVQPDEVFLVIPADIGQAARRQAEEFHRLVGITGIIVTKLDGTAKGGGALTSAAVSRSGIRFIGTGEKIEDFELYDPPGFVSRLIGYGDLKGLLEKAKEEGVEVEEESMDRFLKGRMTMNDFYQQFSQLQKMGSLSKVAEMIPGFSSVKIPKGMMDIQEEKIKKWKFIIGSMTGEERENPDIIKTTRIARIAKGSGTKEQEVRELLKYYHQSRKVLKMVKGGKGLKRGPLASIAKQLGFSMGNKEDYGKD